MSRHGFAIVGCGMIAEYHARAIAEVPRSRLVAAFSRNLANADKIVRIAGECGASGKQACAVHSNLAEMLDRDDIDIVCICTPSGAHMEPAVAAAQAGKHVVVEKPLEISLARCDRIIRACNETGTKLCTIFPSRFSPANRLLYQAIQSGKFGKLTMGDTYVKWWRSQQYYDSGGWRGTWKLDGGGALMNQAIHNVDLLYWLMGEVAEISAFTDTLAHDRIEVEDVAVACLRFRSGALGVIEATTSAFPGLAKRTEIHGTRGSAAVEQDDITLWKFDVEAAADRKILEQYSGKSSGKAGASDPRGITHAGHAAQLRDLVNAIDTGREPLVDGSQGRKSVEIIRAIYRSASTGKLVRLPLSGDLLPSRSALKRKRTGG